MMRVEARGWLTYLRVVTIGMAAFSLATVVTPWVSDGLFAWMIFGKTGTPAGFTSEAADYVRFSHGVLGAVMLGWFAMIAWLLGAVETRSAAATWQALAFSLGLWFAVDSSFSLLTGNWPNAVLNVGVLAAYVPGLAGTRPRGLRAQASVTDEPSRRSAPGPADRTLP